MNAYQWKSHVTSSDTMNEIVTSKWYNHWQRLEKEETEIVVKTRESTQRYIIAFSLDIS